MNFLNKNKYSELEERINKLEEELVQLKDIEIDYMTLFREYFMDKMRYDPKLSTNEEIYSFFKKIHDELEILYEKNPKRLYFVKMQVVKLLLGQFGEKDYKFDSNIFKNNKVN